ncbi:UDP-glucose dehydrogenase family protein [Bernardetia sp.]|uniref:UDP-glucose dehydrogenase family protein n=1 Tax=Bernardetia sp. TaxID=1937974 RepID=UPI0025C4BEFB|nr:UDP-glucose/GDP-mannose dehydrogenase family protein [Bernardetia sp.]
MKLAVIGTGYVGLVSGTCFAETGNQVMCVDIDENKINRLKSGKLTIYEPGLQVLFERNIKQERLLFTTDLEEAVKDAQIIFLALPTPPGEDGSADLSYVLGVAEQLGKIITDYKVIVDKSTVPVGTAEKVHAAIAKNAKTEFDVVSNPEFLREGVAVDDFLKPDRVVVGTSSEKAKKLMEKLYSPYVRQGNPVIFMDERSAEMTKYAANSYLATRISFMNEIANICELVGANVDFVRKGMGSDNRIGQRFLFAGVGYGGSCFPKDVQALERTANESNYNFKILDSVMKVNERQKVVMIDKIKSFYGEDLTGKHFAMWGLAFKPNTDDIREAPALYIIDELLEAGATISTFDPEAMENVLEIYEGDDRVSFEENQYNTLKNADALIIVTEWNVFRTPNFEKTFSIMKERVIFDGRNVFDLEQMADLKTYYNSIGRQVVDTREKKQIPQEA